MTETRPIVGFQYGLMPYSIQGSLYLEKVKGSFYKLTQNGLIRYIPTEELDYAIEHPFVLGDDNNYKFKIRFKDNTEQTIYFGMRLMYIYALEDEGKDYEKNIWDFEGVISGTFYKLTPTENNSGYRRRRRLVYIFVDDLKLTNSESKMTNSERRKDADRYEVVSFIEFAKDIVPTAFVSEYFEEIRKREDERRKEHEEEEERLKLVMKREEEEKAAAAAAAAAAAKAMKEKKELNNAIYGSHKKSTNFVESLGTVGGPGYGGGKRKSKKNKTRKHRKTRKH